VVPYMRRARWGRIISIAGTAGWQPSNTAMADGLSNAAVINWTKSMSLQYAADGILVTTVAPGSIETPRTVGNRQREADIRGVSLDEQLKARVQDIPLQRLGRPGEIAAVVVFLASEQSSYITGTCVTAHGGVTRGI